jgi:hypothetical protein
LLVLTIKSLNDGTSVKVLFGALSFVDDDDDDAVAGDDVDDVDDDDVDDDDDLLP